MLPLPPEIHGRGGVDAIPDRNTRRARGKIEVGMPATVSRDRRCKQEDAPLAVTGRIFATSFGLL